MVPPDDRTPADAYDDLAAGYETESRQPVFLCVRAVAPCPTAGSALVP